MAQLPDLSVKFTADTAGFTAATERVSRSVKNLERSVTSDFARMRTAAASFGRNAMTGLLGGFSVGAVVAFGRAALTMASGLNEAAQQVGLTTRELQEFQYVAEQSGVSSEALNSAFAKLNDTIGDAARGNETANNAFAALGVAYMDAAGNVRGAGPVFEDIIRRLAQIPDAATRFSLATAVMGRGAAQLQPIIAAGTAEFERMRNEAHATGLVISDDLANRTDTAMDRMSAAWRRLMVAAAPYVGAIADAVAATLEAAQTMGRTGAQDALNFRLEQHQTRVTALTADVARLRTELDRLNASGTGLSTEAVAAQARTARDMIRAQADLAEAQAAADLIRSRGGRLPGEAPPAPPPPPPPPPAAGPVPVHRDAAAARTASREAERAAREEANAIDNVLDKYLPLRNLEVERNAALNYLDAATQRNTITAQQYASAVSAVSEEYLKQIESATNLGGILVAELSTREQLAQRLEQLQSLFEQGTITQEQYAAATDRARRQALGLQEQWQVMEDAGRGFASAITSGLEAAIFQAKNMKDALRGVVEEIGRVAVRAMILKPLEAVLGAGFSSLTGSMFSTSGAGVGAGVGGGIGHVPTMAQGGIVTGPTLAVVGEGPYPEAVIPMPGGAIPIDGGEREGNRATAILTVNAPNAEAGVERRILAMLRAYEPGLIRRLMDAVQRGGAVSKAFGRS